MKKVNIDIIDEFLPLYTEQHRYKVYYGGRYGAKSTNFAKCLLLKGREEKLRILCTREIQNTIKDSVHKLFKDLISQYEFVDFRVTAESITNNLTGSEFIFKGLKSNITEVKGIEGIDIAWVEEAQSVSKQSWDILDPTVRKEGSEIWVSFNRFTERDPVYEKFVLNQLPNSLVKKVNYDILERAGLLTDVIKQQIDFDKANNPDLYQHKWLGEPLSQTDNAILNRTDVLAAMQRTVNDDGQMEVGIDVARLGEDRTCFYKRKGLKIIDFREYSKKRSNDIVDYSKDFINSDKKISLKIDDTGVGAGVTDPLMAEGYNVMPINFGQSAKDKDKYPNAISEMWFEFRDILKDIQIPYDQDLLMELTTREWKMDIKGRRGVESKDVYKKRGFRSPDKADALLLAFYQPKNITIDVF